MSDLEINKDSEEVELDVSLLVERVDLIDYVSQYIDLEERKGEYWCQCVFHNGDNTASLSFNKEKQTYYCLGCKKRGNIFTFVKTYHKMSNEEAIAELCKYGNLDVGELKAPPDVIKHLRKMKKTFNTKAIEINRKPLDKDCMIVYNHNPIKEWLDEGISQEVLDKYIVRYDTLDKAIVFPIFDNLGNIINIKKRTLRPDFNAKKIPKYIYLHKLLKLDYLYGFAQNKDKYGEYKNLFIFEGEKSVLKMETFGYYNALALGTSSITKEQANTLIKTGKRICICMDKGISLPEIIERFKYLSRFTNTYVIIDRQNLLENKDSPIDKGIDVFKQLYAEKIKL